MMQAVRPCSAASASAVRPSAFAASMRAPAAKTMHHAYPVGLLEHVVSITKVLDFVFVGSSFVFGPLGDRTAWPKIMTAVLGADGAQYSVVFAFQVLPTIIYVAALFAALYYFGVMQFVVRIFAVVMRRFMRASGAESLNVAIATGLMLFEAQGL